jgi:hypothetical protein
MASRTHPWAVVAAGLTMSNVDTTAAYFYCFGVPELRHRPRPVTIAGGIGVIEAICLVLYGISIVAFEQTSQTSGISGSGADLAPAILVALFAVFAALVLLVTWMLSRGRRAARTPFVMVQAFAIVVGQPLAAATSTRTTGIALIALALLAVGLLFSSSAKEYLQ